MWKSTKYSIFWVCVCSLGYPACNALYCHLCSARLYNIFLRYLINGTFFGRKVIKGKMWVLFFSTTSVWNIPHSKNKWARYDKNVHRSSCKVPLFLSDFNQAWIFSTVFWKILQFHENPFSGNWVVPCGQTDRQTDRYNEAYGRFSQFRKHA